MRSNRHVQRAGQSVLCTIFLLIAALPGVSPAQTQPDGIYIIFDASGSMWQKLPDQSLKIETAKQVLQEFFKRDFKDYELAFRAYGHRTKGDCQDSELITPFSPANKALPQLAQFMKSVSPKGKTPIHLSLTQALTDFGDRGGEIILISDGIETCDADPCELVRLWREKKVNIRVHVVGLGLDQKSRQAMRCISEAAGTEYYDAGSAEELMAGLQDIKKKAVASVLKIVALDADGESHIVHGSLWRDGKQLYEVGSHRRNVVEPGKYTLSVGIRTRNTHIYKPVSLEIDIPEGSERRVEVTVATPPRVRAKFLDGETVERGALIRAYQNGEEVFAFRAKDEIYVDEGAYEFRSQPNKQNKLAITETFAAGDDKEIIFQMVHTVHARFKLVASGSGLWFRQNYELWQNGEKKHLVHVRNGVRVLPGQYDLRLPDTLTPHEIKGVTITTEPEQIFEFVVPSGHVTFVYQTATGARDKDKRCFVGRAGSSTHFKMSGKKFPLTAGSYYVKGWRGDYDDVPFDVAEGEEKDIIIRAKK